MINIYNDSLKSNVSIQAKDTNSVKSNNINGKASSKDKIENKTDTLQLSNKNAINVAKAKDAFSKTLGDFKNVHDKFGDGDMTGPLAIMNDVMRLEGKTPIDFSPNSNMSFLSYVDDLTETVKGHPDLVPSNFLDFCTELKSNLEKADCK